MTGGSRQGILYYIYNQFIFFIIIKFESDLNIKLNKYNFYLKGLN